MSDTGMSVTGTSVTGTSVTGMSAIGVRDRHVACRNTRPETVRMNQPAPAGARARAAGPRLAALATAAAIAFGTLASLATPAAALAQALRSIPASAVPGKLEPKAFPEALLDGRPVRLSAGARIHDRDNRIVLPASLAGARLKVLYARDFNGQIDRVWLPSEAEFAAANARRR